MLKWQQDSWTFRNTNNFTYRKSKNRLPSFGLAYKGQGSESNCEGVGEGEGEGEGVGGL